MPIGYNEDLTTAILLRLPAKSLLRLKTVSKQWLSIIFNRQFRQIHAASAPGAATATGLFLNLDTTTLGFLSLDNHTSPMPNSNQHIEILSSSGGLLLLLLQSRDYCICNPTTNEIQPLAAVPQLIKDYGVSAYLAFDAYKSVHYKVLFVCYRLFGLDKVQFVIYSSETRTFRSLEIIHYLIPAGNGVYWIDAIHWISVWGVHGYFDLSKECMNKSSFPAIAGNVEYYGESRGNLLAVTLVSNGSSSVFEVYELKSDYSAWSFKCKIDIDSIQNEVLISLRLCYMKVSSILDDEKKGLTMVLQVRSRFDTFVVFNVKKKKKMKLNNVSRLRDHDGYLSGTAHQYKPTLAWVLE